MPKRAVIIVAGGTGTRMQSSTAKQFLPLCGKPVILHTFEAFKNFDPDISFILVLFKSLEQEWKELIAKHNFKLEHQIVYGGAERFHSVQNGLKAIADDVELVAIHDAVRPLVSQDTISRCFAAAETTGAAIPVIPVIDTIRRNSAEGSITLPRQELLAVQTPQCFKRGLLQKAYLAPYRDSFTDDASVVESAGYAISEVEGNRTNIKITTREDLLIAKALMQE